MPIIVANYCSWELMKFIHDDDVVGFKVIQASWSRLWILKNCICDLYCI